MNSAPGDEYEELVREIVGRLASRAEVETTNIERDVRVPGRATPNQIDVLWDFDDASGCPRRVVFEARHYKDPIKQGALHAFRSVVDDIQDDARPVLGVMVTTTGYQPGAQRVAETYGVLVLELRRPTSTDFDNRVTKVSVTFTPVIPVVQDITFDFVEIMNQDALVERSPWDPIYLRQAGGNEMVSLQHLLTDGELGTVEAPRGLHAVRRTFDVPATLFAGQEAVATVSAVGATVGSSAAPPVTITINGLESVAWMLRDAVSDARVWFGADDKVWATGPEILPIS